MAVSPSTPPLLPLLHITPKTHFSILPFHLAGENAAHRPSAPPFAAFSNLSICYLEKDTQKNKEISGFLELMKDEAKMKALSENITKLGISDAAERILVEIEKLIKEPI